MQLYKSFTRDKQEIHCIRANSHELNTFRKVKALLGTRMIDFLFLDGDHTYNGVKSDFEMYSSLVKKGGIIAFHDIISHDKYHNPDGTINVNRFWIEIKNSYKNIELIKDINQGWAGIGIIYK
jgi:predicted O-methyltransferase YrrM